MISREAIEERIRLLKQERIRLIASLQTVDGALQECERWLEEFDKPQPPPEPPKPPEKPPDV